MQLSDLDLTQIRLAAYLIETKSVARAAKRIGLSPSAASHTLARMRSLLGDPLFVVSKAGFVPTPAGERIGAAAKDALAVLSADLDLPSAFNPLTTDRRFSAYMSNVGQAVFLPKLIKTMARKAPHASFRALATPSEGVAAALASGEVDLAVGLLDNLVNGFRGTAVCRDHYVCVVRKSHPLFRSGMSREAFAAAWHAIVEPRGVPHTIVNQTYELAGLRRKVRLLAHGFAAVPMMLVDSDLVATLPNRYALQLAAYFPIKILPPPIPLPGIAIKAYWHDRYHADPTNTWLRRLIASLFRKGDQG